MDVEGAQTVFALGCAGGICNEVLHWWNVRRDADFPAYARKIRYWVVTVLMILLGGFVAYLFCGDVTTALAPFQIGLTTPMLLQRLARAAPKHQGARGDGATLLNFLSV